MRLLGLALICVGSSAIASPFLTRDQNPLLAGFALPLPAPADLVTPGTSRLDLIANWSSTASSGLNGPEALLVDLESRELRLIVEYSFAPNYALRMQLPYRQLNEGVLDGFIDGWHRALGLPEGARRFLERDQYQVGYLRSGQRILNLYEPTRGIGDIVIELGHQVWRGNDSAASIWIFAEAPTGDEHTLLGNGSWDAGVQIAGRTAVSARSVLHWQAAASHLGDGRYLSPWQNSWAASLVVAFEYAATRRFSLKAQVDAHSAVYESGLDFLGDAAILTLGGHYQLESGAYFTAGVGEDVAVGASPDVNFYFALGKSF